MVGIFGSRRHIGSNVELAQRKMKTCYLLALFQPGINHEERSAVPAKGMEQTLIAMNLSNRY